MKKSLLVVLSLCCIALATGCATAHHGMNGRVTMVGTHKVKDFAVWKEVFDGAANMRKANGEMGCDVMHSVKDWNDVTLICEWQDMTSAKEFMSSKMLKDKMQEAGVMGKPNMMLLISTEDGMKMGMNKMEHMTSMIEWMDLMETTDNI